MNYHVIDLDRVDEQTKGVIVSKSTQDGRKIEVAYHTEDNGVAFIKYNGVMLMFAVEHITVIVMVLRASIGVVADQVRRCDLRDDYGRGIVIEHLARADHSRPAVVITEFGPSEYLSVASINNTIYLRGKPQNDVDTLCDILSVVDAQIKSFTDDHNSGMIDKDNV